VLRATSRIRVADEQDSLSRDVIMYFTIKIKRFLEGNPT